MSDGTTTQAKHSAPHKSWWQKVRTIWNDDEEYRYYRFLLRLFLLGVAFALLNSPCPHIVSDSPTLSGVLCPAGLKDWNFLLEILNKIGEALIIATFLAVIVDESAKRKLIKEFSLDISAVIIGRFQPEELRNHLRAYLEMPFVRTNWHVVYKIEQWKNDEGTIEAGFIKLTTTSEYQMENWSPGERKYEFTYELDESTYPAGRARITHMAWPGGTASAEKLASLRVEEQLLRYRPPEQIPLNPFKSKRANEPDKFKTESTECYRDSAYVSFFAGNPGTAPAKVTVEYDEQKFAVMMQLTYDNTKPVKREPSKDRVIWTIQEPILPGQGFVVRWDPIPPAPTAGGGAATAGKGLVEGQAAVAEGGAKEATATTKTTPMANAPVAETPAPQTRVAETVAETPEAIPAKSPAAERPELDPLKEEPPPSGG